MSISEMTAEQLQRTLDEAHRKRLAENPEPPAQWRCTKAELDAEKGTLTLAFEHIDGIPRWESTMKFDRWVRQIEDGYYFRALQRQFHEIVKTLKRTD